jgi:adenine-specific DNA-methyltransferase
MTKVDITNVFGNPYDPEKYISFISELFNGNIIRLAANPIYLIGSGYQDHIKSYTEFASYKNEFDRILILAVELHNESQLLHARSRQRNFTRKLLEKNDFNAALIAFYVEGYEEDWRFSFVQLENNSTEQGGLKNLTPCKRSSYLFGQNEPSHMAKRQWHDLLLAETNPTLQDIKAVFSVEWLTKEFFEKYKEKYLELKEHLDADPTFQDVSPEKGFTSEEFAKKVLGQLSFLYFLQKKGWLGVPTVPVEIASEEWDKIYQSMETELARHVFDRAFHKVTDNHYQLDQEAIRDFSDEEGEIVAQAFKETPHYRLFGEGDKRFIRTLFTQKKQQSFYTEVLEPLFYLALNNKRGASHYFPRLNCRIPYLNGGVFEPIDRYDWKRSNFHIPDDFFSNEKETGILDIFDLYNFTLNESEPWETEVAIDPEMLGKIFENLLDVKDRKSKGAFYTPREIVRYMCQESLVNYLTNKTGITKEDLRQFFYLGEYVKEDEAAMPSSIFLRLEELDQALQNVRIADPAVGSGAFPLGLLNEIVKARMILTRFLIREDEILRARSAYHLKMETMKNTIFAVDIERSAVDITKLRLWLSLIVDDESEAVNPLPNLDYNIRTGNSLIEEFEGIKLFDEALLTTTAKPAIETTSDQQFSLFKDHSKDIMEHLYSLQQQLFHEHDRDKWEKIKQKVEKTEWDFIEYKWNKDGRADAVDKIKKLKKESKPYFLWKLEFSKIFKEKGGFDIVIGNPPYGAELSAEQKKSIKSRLVDTNNLNTAAVFIDYSKNYLLNEQGTLSFIVPKSLLYSEKWSSLACALLEKTDSLIDVEKAFEKVKLEQVVFVYNHFMETKTYRAKKFLDKKFIRENVIDNFLVRKYKAWICDVMPDELEILRRLDVEVDYMKNISTTKRGVGLQKFLGDKGNYPVLGGKNIFRFGCVGNKGYISKEIIEKHKDKFAFMQNQKILSQDLIAHIQHPRPHILLTSCYDDSGQIVSLDTVQNTILTDENYDYRYILGLLNSNFVSWYTYKFIYCSAIRTMHFDKNYMGRIIIPKLSKEKQEPMIQLVKELENHVKTSKGEKYIQELNQMVYQLYGLSSQEMEVIEGFS